MTRRTKDDWIPRHEPREPLIRFGSTITTNGRRPWHAPQFFIKDVRSTETNKAGKMDNNKHS
jgi:hypothetical protein